MLALVLAIMWLPISAHCEIEAATGLEFLACDNGHSEQQAHHKDASCQDDSCVEVEGGLYRIDDSPTSVPAALLATAYLICFSDGLANPGELSIAFPQAPPRHPDLLLPWQFIERCTGSPRAPTSI
jgi:hypothetical protein